MLYRFAELQHVELKGDPNLTRTEISKKQCKIDRLKHEEGAMLCTVANKSSHGGADENGLRREKVQVETVFEGRMRALGIAASQSGKKADGNP